MPSRAEMKAKLDALSKSLATIEFTPDGTILDANPNFLAAVGYSLDEVKGRHHGLFLDPVERAGDAYRGFWAALARGEFQSAEFRRIAKGGREVFIQVYRPRIVRHRSEAYAAKAAGGSCAARTAAGGRNPCRSISHVSL
ncbi:PAS domain S-box-containing protein [Methylobacterium sp. PvP109]|uniref:PAS domain S-box-containing protein n=2 Tax=Methylobacterium radiotolerans TaxID=31998 RepID=A0ABV2NTM3_9HYPH|nr:PAS domain-containing protein [Methylobacterium sp. PvP109]MBP2506293.1 PAS domain S-box-containing protein [Methylobacterium sp. PvP109]